MSLSSHGASWQLLFDCLDFVVHLMHGQNRRAQQGTWFSANKLWYNHLLGVTGFIAAKVKVKKIKDVWSLELAETKGEIKAQPYYDE